MSHPVKRPRNEAEAASIVLNTIQRPVVMIDSDDFFSYANADAEDFFRSSAVMLSRRTLAQFVPYDSPIISLVEQVRERRAPVNEYRVDITSPTVAIRHHMAFLTEDRKDTGCMLILNVLENMQIAVLHDKFVRGGFVQEGAIEATCVAKV